MWSKWRALFTVGAFFVVLFVFLSTPKQANATAGINQELSFEGKVVTSAGINIPDGTYNMEFKIYNAATTCTPSTGSGCTLAWTEDYLVGSAEGGITFTSGTFVVPLGSVCSFNGGACESYTNSAINWNTYPLYLSLQIGNTSSCTISTNFTSNCGGDTEMKPYILLTSTPYSLNSNELGGLTAASFAQLTASQTFTGLNIFAPSSNSANALQVENASGSDLINASTSATSNLLTYPSFEDGSFTSASTGWIATTPGTIAQNTTAADSYDGLDSLNLTTTSSNGGAQTSAFTGTVGAGTYYVSFYAMPSTAMNASAFTITLNDGTAHTCSPATQTLSTSSFVRVSCSATTGSNLSTLTIAQNDSSARSIYIDDVQLQPTGVTNYQLGTLQLPGTTLTTPAVFENAANSNSAFQIQNNAGTDVLNVDTSGSNVTINGTDPAALSTWTSTTNTPVAVEREGGIAANGYMYLLGGDNSSNNLSSVYYAPINGNGTLGSWSTGTSLPLVRKYFNPVVVGNYIYVVGGSDASTVDNTVYYAELNPNGSVGAWQTSPNTLTAAVGEGSTVAANGYIYELGGENTSFAAVNTVYYTQVNANGSIGTWQTSTHALPAVSSNGMAVAANGYLYYLGGNTGYTAVYYSLIGANGLNGAWTTSTNSVATLGATGARISQANIVNGYIYAVSGSSGNTYYASLNASTGANSTWTSITAPPSTGAFTTYDGYLYNLGGSQTLTTTDYYASTSRTTIGGSLDLVGADGGTLNNPGTGGSLTAGNTAVVGTLTVDDQATFLNNVADSANLSVGGSGSFEDTTNSTTAFQVQNASGNNILAVDTSGNQVQLGKAGTGGTNGQLLFNSTNASSYGVTINTSASETASYTLTLPITGPSTSQCLQSGASTASQLIFASCSAGGTTALQAAYTASTGGTTPQILLTSGEGTLNIQDASTSIGSNLFNIRASVGSGLGQVLLGVGNTGAVTLENSVNSTAALRVENSSTASVFNVDTTNGEVAIDSTYTAMSSPTGLTVAAGTATGTLSNSLTYYYQVTAVDASGGETTPTAVSGGTTTPTTGSINLYWTAVTGAYGYNIYRCSGASCSEVYLTTVLTNYSSTNPYVDTGVLTVGSATPPSTTTAYLSTNSLATSPEMSVGGYGSPTGQLYVSGEAPTTSIGGYNTTDQIYDAVVGGDYLYASDSTAQSIETFNINNPDDPTLEGTPLSLSSEYPVDMALQGQYLYSLTTGDFGSGFFEVYNVSNPSTIGRVAQLGLPGGAQSDVYDNNGLVVAGNYVYLLDGNGNLDIYNISNPNLPYLASSTAVAGGSGSNSASSIAVSGNYAYLTYATSSGAFLQVVNVANPSAPSIAYTSASTFLPSGNNTTDPVVTVQGSYAYVSYTTSSGGQLAAIDISNPTAPVLLSDVTTAASPGYMVAEGRYLYLGSGYGAYYVEDISDPGNMRQIASLGGIGWIQIQGRYLYAYSPLKVYDLGGAYIQELQAGGTETGTLTVDTTAQVFGSESVGGGLAVDGNTEVDGSLGVGGQELISNTTNSTNAFQVQTSAGNSVLDVDTVNDQVDIDSTYAPMSSPTGLTVAAASSGSGSLSNSLTYYYEITATDDVGGETAPSTQSTGVTPTHGILNVYWTAVTGAYSYRIYRCSGTSSCTEDYLTTVLSNYSSGTPYADNGSISTASITPPTSTTAYVSTDTVAAEPEVSIGGYGTASGQLYVSGNVPSTPLATLGSFTNGSGIATQGKYLYEANQSGLSVYDISNPVDPILLNTTTITGGNLDFSTLQIQGKYLYVSTGGEVTIIDISSPANPALAGTLTLAGPGYVQGRYLYSDTANSGLTAYDISNPSSPIQLGTSQSVFCSVGQIFAYGRYVYAISDQASCHQLAIFDISNPAQPNLVESYPLGTAGDTFTALYVQGGYAYLADGNNDTVYIVDIDNPTNPTTVGSIVTSDPAALFAQDHYLYVGNFSSSTATIQTVDVTNPGNPRSLGTTPISFNDTEDMNVLVNGRYLYGSGETATAAYVEIYDLGGAYIQQLEAGGAEIGSLTVDTNSSITGNESIGGGLSVGTSINVAGSSTLGGLTINGLVTPAAPTVAETGGTGTTYDYEVSAFNNSGSTPASAFGTDSGPSSLTGSTYNTITWSAVSGAVGYNIYRTVGGSSQGYIATVYTGVTLSYADKGTTAVTTSTAPTSSTAGSLTADGQVTFQDANNSTTAFQIENNIGSQIFSVNTATAGIYVNGTTTSDGTITANDGSVINDIGAGASALTVNNNLGIPILSVGSNNFLVNGDFEGGSSAGWAATGGSAAIAVNTNPAYIYSGADSLQITSTATNNGGEVTVFNNPMAAGTYVLSFYAATASGTITTMEASFNALGTSNCMSSQTVTTTFTYFSCTVTTSGTTTAVSIGDASSGTQIFYIDAVQVVSSTNLVSNPGFESNITGWTSSGTSTLSQNLIRSFVYYGQASLKVVISAASSGATDSTFIATQPAGTYDLSFYAMMQTGTLTTLTATLGGVACLSAQTVVSTGFTQFNCSATTAGSPTIIITGGSTTSGTMYVDDVQLTNGSTLSPYNIGQIQLRGIVNNPVTFESVSNSNVALQIDNASGSPDLLVDTLDGVVEIGSLTANSNTVLLGLNNYNTFADPSNTCSSTADTGTLYYNSNTNAVRDCTNGAWEDLVSTDDLSLQLFGVVPNSGTTPGDLVGASGLNKSPCKVYFVSTTAFGVAPCVAYSGGRRVNVTAIASQNVANITTTAIYENICLNSSGVPTQMSGSNANDGAETLGNLSASSATTLGQPLLCLATLKGNGTANTLSTIYDVRTFTNTTKTYATLNSATQALGGLVTQSTAGLVTQPTTASAIDEVGVLVAGTGSASSGAPNVIIATAGPQWIKATGTSAADGNVLSNGATATPGYSETGTLATTAWANVGVGQVTIGTSCSTDTFNALTDCQDSQFTTLDIAP